MFWKILKTVASIAKAILVTVKAAKDIAEIFGNDNDNTSFAKFKTTFLWFFMQ